MNLLLVSRAAVFVAVLTCRAIASPPAATLDVDPALLLAPNPIVARGMSRETVQLMLGTPGAKLSPNAWVYWEFKAKGVTGSTADDALVVGFTADRVTLLRLCRSEAVRAFIAQPQGTALKATVAAK